MKTLKELFTEAGISEELQGKFNELLKGGHTNGGDLEVVIANNGEYVKAEKYDTLKSQYEAALTGKADLEKKVNDYSTLQSELDKVKAEYGDFKTKSANNEDTLRKQFEVEKRIISNNLPPINGSYDAYIKGVDLEKVTKNDKGEFVGIDDAFNTFKENNKILFEKMNTTIIPPDNGPKRQEEENHGITNKEFAKMGYKDRLNLKANEPELYAELAKQENPNIE